MAGIVALEDRWQEAFTWQLRVDEAEEKAARLELDLEIMRAQKEQAEAKVAALELRVQPGKKEGGSKEIRRLMASGAEKTRALERLVAEEAKKSRQREEQLREMQEELAEWRRKSPEPDRNQTGEQKEVMQKLEISKSLIATLQKEVYSQVEQIESLEESRGLWQERCDQAERIAEELRKKLAEDHTRVEETRKVIIREMERVKEYTASQEALEAQK
ncbi:tropomyosin alpha-3 chain-like [Alligator mississippiensis]|uniref:tropomyosin alpha-3 chain-like n=1 Tax=Alligator mississippiensis TaxID=8496 RepID=UPI0028774B24|nr:tropomyosin alpha-3 chain-like [Alligator mississippiensis]